jgi:hypothetical protein
MSADLPRAGEDTSPGRILLLSRSCPGLRREIFGCCRRSGDVYRRVCREGVRGLEGHTVRGRGGDEREGLVGTDFPDCFDGGAAEGR